MFAAAELALSLGIKADGGLGLPEEYMQRIPCPFLISDIEKPNEVSQIRRKIKEDSILFL